MKKKKKYALSFLIVGLCFSLGTALLVGKTETIEHIPFRWSNLARLDEMKALLKGFEIKSMIDTCCESEGLIEKLDLGIERYIGVNRSQQVINAIRSSVGSAQRTFLIQDITRDPLPKADLIVCWDTLQQMPASQIRSTLQLFKKSGIKYLLVAHHPEVKKNLKNRKGQDSSINWTLAPYRFPEPIVQISEQQENNQLKNLALWKISDLP